MEQLRALMSSLQETEVAASIGTSLVSLAVPAGASLAPASQLLTKECVWTDARAVTV